MYAEHMKTYFAVLIPLLVLDAVWLGAVARGFYRTHLGYLMTDNYQWWAAAVFYLLFAIGLAVFVVQPNMSASVVRVFMLGALFGLVAYATYDLTNQTTIRSWPLIVTVVDLAWGAFISGVVSVIAVRLLKL